MKRFLTLFRIEAMLGLRCPDGLIFGVGMPLGVLLLIAVVAGEQTAGTSELTFLQSGFASLITVGICATAFMGIPLTFADYRDKKILKHFFVTPVSPMLMFLVQIAVAMATSFLSAGILIVVAITVFHYQMPGNAGLFFLAYLLVMMSMYGIGLIMASLCRTVKIANLVTSFVYFPMLFLSGATIPFELFPKGLQTVANILPLTHGIRLLKDISLGIASSDWMTSVVILVVFGIAGMIISVVSFQWE